jgi:NCAIR mutase (PurE)-related protein
LNAAKAPDRSNDGAIGSVDLPGFHPAAIMDMTPKKEFLRLRKQGLAQARILTAMRATLTENLGFAHLDHDRERRKGFPEVVFGQGKTPPQISAIAGRLLARSGRLLVTRVPRETYLLLKTRFPFLKYDEEARAIYHAGDAELRRRAALSRGHVLVVCAGTSDIPVAAEAALTARLLGCRVKTVHDVGVAGLHRLLAKVADLRRASVIVAVAGMEGALPSVIAGLVDKPVIGVPTSVGYGASLGGMAALLAILNSCASGLTVVNIDNGFGAGYAAAQILRLSQTGKQAGKRAGKALRTSKPRS